MVKIKSPQDTLIRAIRLGDWAMAEAAVRDGASSKASLKAAVVMAANQESDGMKWLQWVIAHGADVKDPDVLAFAAGFDASPNAEAVSALLSAGADPNANEGASLQAAVLSQRAAVVQVLLRHGADPTAYGSLALGIAYAKGNEAIVQDLLAAGADPFGSEVFVTGDAFEHRGCGDLIRAARVGAAAPNQ